MQAPGRDGKTQYLYSRGTFRKTLRVSHFDVRRFSAGSNSTPRSPEHIGTIVSGLHGAYHGGDLKVRHGGPEVRF